MNPKETFFSVAKENWILRMVCLLLGLSTMVSCFTAYLLSKKPALVWIVTHDGKISNNKDVFFDWEAEELIRKAVEIFYVPSPNRSDLIPSYFSQELAESAKKFEPRDRLATFIVDKLDNTGTGITVQGTLKRSNESDEKLLLSLNRVERTQANPFGLVIVRSEKYEEKEETKPEGLVQEKK